MLTRLATFLVRRRRAVIWLSALFFVGAAVVGTGAFGVLEDEGFTNPSAESVRADEVQGMIATDSSSIVVLATAAAGDVDDPAAAAAGRQLTADIAEIDGVLATASYWTTSEPSMVGRSGAASMVTVQTSDDADEEDVAADIEELADAVPSDVLRVGMTGGDVVGAEFAHTIEGDLARAEMIAIPITLLLLIVVFGGLVAASLPLVVGALTVMGTFMSLFLIGSATDVSVYAVNLTTALGLGLAIDYSLFIVNRFREELAAGATVERAVVRTLETAGRTVVLSGLTVAASLSALLVFREYFLRSFAYSGVAVVLMAMMGSLITLPAILASLGHRVDRVRLLRRRRPAAESNGVWYRIARSVMRRPAPVAVAVVAVLLVLGAPFLGVRFGGTDTRSLPESSEVRQTTEALQAEFAGDTSEAFPVVIDGADGARLESELDTVAAELSALDGVASVSSLGGTYVDGVVERTGPGGTTFTAGPSGWMDVVPSIEMSTDEGETLVERIRDVEPATGELLVGGSTAEQLDSRASIGERLPLAIAIIVVMTFLLLFALSGSVVVPIKALVLNLLSLTATFGAMVWIFQDGHLAEWLNFTPSGHIETSMPILMFCIAFGLSMDYEVFLLSRIKEEHDRTGDNEGAVALGLERTGRVITAAALLMAVTFFAFATSGVAFIKMFGLGLGVAVLMDAFVIRGLLVPAFMKLAGEVNWWAPAPLRRLHRRIAITEG